MKLITKIYLSIGFILLFFVLVTVTFFKQAQKDDANMQEVLVSTEIMKSTVAISRAIVSAQTGLRGYLLVGEETFLDPYYEGQAEFLIEVNLLRTLCKKRPENLALIQQVDSAFHIWKNSIADSIIPARAEAESSVAAQKKYDKLFFQFYKQQQAKIKIEKIKRLLNNLEKKEIKTKNLLVREAEKSRRNTNILGIILTSAAILAGLITAILLGQTIHKRMITLKNLASNLAQGNFNYTAKDLGNDELSSLALDMEIMAKKLKISFNRLHKMNQELDQFAYVVSHDLKAPLRAINNLAEWISEDIGESTPEIKTNLQLMRGRVHRMENLINGILEYARVGRKNLDKSTFTIRNLLQEIIESLEIPAHIAIKLPETDLIISTQRILLHQVLANLIGNAIKYNNQPVGWVHILLKESDRQLSFTIVDNGPGISGEYHDKIFGVFQTIESRDTKESTGIGLAIVKKIVEEQGGSIKLKSELGKGAAFSFTWPLLVSLSATPINEKILVYEE